jgi:hypothetical protein
MARYRVRPPPSTPPAFLVLRHHFLPLRLLALSLPPLGCRGVQFCVLIPFTAVRVPAAVIVLPVFHHVLLALQILCLVLFVETVLGNKRALRCPARYLVDVCVVLRDYGVGATTVLLLQALQDYIVRAFAVARIYIPDLWNSTCTILNAPLLAGTHSY